VGQRGWEAQATRISWLFGCRRPWSRRSTVTCTVINWSNHMQNSRGKRFGRQRVCTIESSKNLVHLPFVCPSTRYSTHQLFIIKIITLPRRVGLSYLFKRRPASLLSDHYISERVRNITRCRWLVLFGPYKNPNCQPFFHHLQQYRRQAVIRSPNCQPHHLH